MKFAVSVTVIVDADSDDDAYAMVSSVAENLVCGDITEIEMGSVEERE